MPTAWGFCPYEVVTDASGQYRRCAAERFRSAIRNDGGALSYAEVLGNFALVKVRASASTLSAMDAEPGFLSVPRHVSLGDTLADLTTNEKNAIKNKLLALGYTAGQLQTALGSDMGSRTLGELLHFAASRWRRPLAISNGVTVFEVTDWGQAPRSIEAVDGEVN